MYQTAELGPAWSISLGNLAAMAAYVKEAPAVAPPPPAPPGLLRRPPAAAPPGTTGVKLPPLPQKTREALEAAAMQPMYVKDLGGRWKLYEALINPIQLEKIAPLLDHLCGAKIA